MTILAWTIGIGAAVLTGWAVVIAVRYWYGWHHVGQNLDRRLLPLHVWVISASYILLLTGTVVQVAVLVRWWHPLIFLPAIALGLFAMYVMSRIGRRE